MTTLRAGSATNVGQVRAINQDSFLVDDEHRLYGVADGIGGHQGGEVASAMAVEIVEAEATEPQIEVLVRAVQTANRRIFEKAGSDRDLHGMGTTFVAVQVVDGPEGDEIGWINVGDSRVYLFRDDEIVQLSLDHSLVEELVRDGQLSEEEARVHPQRNIVTRSLGIDLDVNADTGTVLAFTGDRFLLCSDGLSNEVSSEQMGAVLRRLADPSEAAAELVRLANESGGRDNITVVIVDVTDDGGRAEAASAILAGQATTVGSTPPPEGDGDPTTTRVPVAGGAGPDDRVIADREVFADQRSSLPASDDDYGSETDDPFGPIDQARARRWTWRVFAFLLLLVLIAVGGVAAIGWSAKNTYFVTYQGDKVAIYQGKPGGVLFFDPKLVEVTSLTRDQVMPAFRDDIADGKQFPSQVKATRYVAHLREAAKAEPKPTPTTTTTAPPATTTTLPGATTAPPQTTTTIAGP